MFHDDNSDLLFYRDKVFLQILRRKILHPEILQKKTFVDAQTAFEHFVKSQNFAELRKKKLIDNSKYASLIIHMPSDEIYMGP
jgi:hypothetical protein